MREVYEVWGWASGYVGTVSTVRDAMKLEQHIRKQHDEAQTYRRAPTLAEKDLGTLTASQIIANRTA